MEDIPKVEELTLDELDGYLIRLASARLGIRRKLLLLKRSIIFWGMEMKKRPFDTEEEMLLDLDDFIYQSKSLIGSSLRDKLQKKIYEFLDENGLNQDQHNFVDISKIQK